MTNTDYEAGYAQALEDLGGFIKSKSDRRAGQSRTAPTEGIGGRIRLLRERAGITQDELADRMRYLGHPFHQATIYKIEVGSRRVLAEEILDFAESLNVEASEIL